MSKIKDILKHEEEVLKERFSEAKSKANSSRNKNIFDLIKLAIFSFVYSFGFYNLVINDLKYSILFGLIVGFLTIIFLDKTDDIEKP